MKNFQSNNKSFSTLRRPKRHPAWFPYPSSISTKNDTVRIVYKGGEQTLRLSETLSIMLYGSICPLDEAFLDACRKHRVPIIAHRRTIHTPIWIMPGTTGTVDDLLTLQILARENKKKSVHIATRLLDAKFRSMEWLMPYPTHFRGTFHTVAELRHIEAWHANEYWKRLYRKIGFPHTSRRTKGNPVTTVLDAVSKLISGVVLRFIVYHHLSPHHGYLHEQSEYPALVYDLLEPHRGIFDHTVHDTIMMLRKDNVPENEWLEKTITMIEEKLDERVYTHTTRQIVTIQELLHGTTLALRAYLKGDATRYMPPVPGRPKGGRPIAAGYRLFGRSPGLTDFWDEAWRVANG